MTGGVTRVRRADELRERFETYVHALPLSPELGRLADAVTYSVQAGGKRIRPVLCLATGEAAGAELDGVLPAAAAVELVHTFGLVHDDLPALDDDAERRGRPSAHVEFGEAVAILAGDALLAEGLRLALSYPTPAVARELADAAVAMIGGQYLDVTAAADDLAALHRLKTGSLFAAAVGCGLWAAGVPAAQQARWRAFAGELGLLFQVVDDILDGDGVVVARGDEAARALADEAAAAARERLEAVPADTSTLAEIVSEVAARLP